jgi:colicin import membrane protein
MTSYSMLHRQFNHNAGFHGMLLFSIVLHVLILSAILFLPSLPSPKLTFGPTYSVQLIGSFETSLARDAAMASGEVIEKIIPDRSVVFKKKTSTPSDVPLKKMDVAKQDSGVEKAVEKIKQRVASVGQVSMATQNQMGDADIAIKMRVYYSSLWIRIKRQWILPEGILPRENLEAIVHAKILRSGEVADLGFEKRSGNRYFDDSALKAVRKAVPLPPLPEWVSGGSLEIGIRFHSSEVQ